METIVSDIKLWRVHRKNFTGIESMYEVVQCYVLAKTWERAKGIAKVRYPSMFEGYPKKDILVEEINMGEEKALDLV